MKDKVCADSHVFCMDIGVILCYNSSQRATWRYYPLKIDKVVSQFQGFLRHRLGATPVMSDKVITSLSEAELRRILDEYPELRRLYLDPRLQDAMMLPEEAVLMPDRLYVPRRVALDEHYGANLSVENHGRFMRNLLRLLGKPQRILDMCCGWGTYPTFLKSRGLFTGEVCGVDASEAMLGKAKWLAEVENVEVKYLLGYVDEGIPFPPEYFDFLFCIDALQHILRWVKAVKNIPGALCPGGRFLIIYPLGFLRSDIPMEEMKDALTSAGLEIEVMKTLATDNFPRAMFYGKKP